MLSRVASSIYWMNRYIERAENYARLIEVDYNLSMELPPGLVSQQWRPLVLTTGDEELFEKSYGEYTKKNVIRFLAFDVKNPNSICSCLFAARENARTVREIIPSDLWMQINEMYLSIRSAIKQEGWNQKFLIEFFREIKDGGHLFSGIMDGTFSRSEGWHFGNIGRFLERADKTGRIIDMKYYYLLPSPGYMGTPLDLMQWSALLKSASAFEMYRKTFGKLDMSNIIKFLVLDREFPRAMRYCLIQAEESLRSVVGRENFSFETKAEKELGRLRSELDYTDVNDIFKSGLHEYLDNIQIKINDVGSAIAETFFAHVPNEKQSQS